MSDTMASNSYLSCAEVARRLGLSRQRFWQLRRDGVFPEPHIDEATGRPYYNEQQLELCLDLRKRNVGMNGRIVLFYSARPLTTIQKPLKKTSRAKPTNSQHKAIIESLRTLGLAAVTEAQVQSALKDLLPIGKSEPDHGELVRNIFLHIQRKNTSR